MQYPFGHEKTEACVSTYQWCGKSGPGFSYMMSKHMKLLRLGKRNAKKLTAGSHDPVAIAADSSLEDPL